MNQLIWNLDRVIRSHVAYQQLYQVWWRSYQRWRPHVVVKYTGRVPFIIIIFVFIFHDTHTAYTREPILTHNSSKDAD